AGKALGIAAPPRLAAHPQAFNANSQALCEHALAIGVQSIIGKLLFLRCDRCLAGLSKSSHRARKRLMQRFLNWSFTTTSPSMELAKRIH
ncbi:hypothetical protein, partial [Comamonas kerstersii]|uniref:hypothetical protein n=1 Tax=Comamonas kerstersii TaxID=225992 RepID=UPI001964CBD5